jgi:outer membrane lipoprotein SlyB
MKNSLLFLAVLASLAVTGCNQSDSSNGNSASNTNTVAQDTEQGASNAWQSTKDTATNAWNKTTNAIEGGPTN